VFGRALEYSTAREMALKLEETCYLIATAFSTADFRHGPAALVERGLPVVLFAAPGPCLPDALETLAWLRDQHADTVVVSEDEPSRIWRRHPSA
jgi:glucosamine--fructose-6-phosphate aminotransferase (isomerizing)